MTSRPTRIVAQCTLLLLAACAGGAAVPPDLARLLSEAPNDAAPRLVVAGDTIVAATVPLAPGLVPPVVRTTFDAIAPGGETLFVGREWSERGDGFRIEKRYTEGVPHVRSVLADAGGAVLERWHTVAIPEVPQHVLAAALRQGPFVDEARIVSGPEVEEYWDLLARDRGGDTFVVRIALDGRQLRIARRLTTSVEAR